MAVRKPRRPVIRGFTRIGTSKVPTPKQTKKQLFIKSRLLIFNPKALKAARRRGTVF